MVEVVCFCLAQISAIHLILCADSVQQLHRRLIFHHPLLFVAVQRKHRGLWMLSCPMPGYLGQTVDCYFHTCCAQLAVFAQVEEFFYRAQRDLTVTKIGRQITLCVPHQRTNHHLVRQHAFYARPDGSVQMRDLFHLGSRVSLDMCVKAKVLLFQNCRVPRDISA